MSRDQFPHVAGMGVICESVEPFPKGEIGEYEHDRCCCECGTHFDGTLEDDYCNPCYDELIEDYLDVIPS